MLDVLGDDWWGSLIKEEFEREGVATEALIQSRGCTSSIASILVRCEDGERSIVFMPGNTPDYPVSKIPSQMIAASKILHINGRHWESCMKASRFARKSGVKISFDGGAHRFRLELTELVPLTDICIVARDFAEAYTSQSSVEKAAQVLMNEGPPLVVITDGLRGSWIFQKGHTSFHQAAYDVPNVIDTTGCGDSYHGAFLFGLIRSMDLKQTACLASAVAAMNAQHLGGRTGLPRLEKVQQFMSQHRDGRGSDRFHFNR
jgi:sugar/nucleoside kinase (ribokinase family)